MDRIIPERADERDTDTPTYEAVQNAEWHRDRDARMLADAVIDGSLDEQPHLARWYAESAQAAVDVRAAWSASIDAMLAERGLEVTQ